MSDLIITDDRALAQHASDNPALVYIASLPSAHSRRNMTRYLNQMAGRLTAGRQDALALDWAALRFQHTTAIRTQLMSTYAPATVNAMLSALRGVLKSAWRLGQMSAEDYQRAIDVQNVKGETLPAGRQLTPGEIMALSTVCQNDDSVAGVRDAAMIGLLATQGPRRSEVVAIQREHVDLDTGLIEIRGGKGRKDRTNYIAGGALAAMLDWLKVRGDESGPLFLSVNKGGKIMRRYDTDEGVKTLRGLTSQAIHNMLAKRGKQAGITRPFSAHDFRRTVAGELIEKDDIVNAQKILGHAAVSTTGRYDRRPEAAKKKAASKMHFPYTSRRLD